MTSETGTQTITINVLPGISKCKENPTMLYYNNDNIFLQKTCRKQGRETSSGPLFVF